MEVWRQNLTFARFIRASHVRFSKLTEKIEGAEIRSRDSNRQSKGRLEKEEGAFGRIAIDDANFARIELSHDSFNKELKRK